MTNIIVAFSKLENARNIKNILMRNGFQVMVACTSGAQVLSSVEGLNSGIVVCGHSMTDMVCSDLYDCLPPDFSLVVVSSPARWSSISESNIVKLGMPLKVHELVDTLENIIIELERSRKRRKLKAKVRSDGDREIVMKAKMLLMERNNMTENEAHKYIQKCSMDSGTNMVETAQMVMSLM